MSFASEITSMVLRQFHRAFLRNKNIKTIFGSSFDGVIESAISALGVRHFSGEKYRLPVAIEYAFSECIEDSIDAFINKLCRDNEMDIEDVDIIKEYLISDAVSTEFSKLLEPGTEYFDIYYLTDVFGEIKDKRKVSVNSNEILLAWKEFVRGFSFSTRSKHGFREFISASYDEGSFLALNDIRSAIENVERSVDATESQRDILDDVMDEYISDLKSHKEWAVNFNVHQSKRSTH